MFQKAQHDVLEKKDSWLWGPSQLLALTKDGNRKKGFFSFMGLRQPYD